jgi:hypothetical protein
MENLTQTNQIENALASENITAQVIAKLKKNYFDLKINGLSDKEGFKAVEIARKECKTIRVLASKICKKGREDAIQIQKDWINKEKEVVSQIEEIELRLEAESNKIKEEEKRILFEAAQREKLPVRKEKLLSIGVTIEDSELLKIDDAQFMQLFNEFYEKYLAEKAEVLRIEEEKRRAEMELKLEKERAEKEKLLLEEKQKAEAENKRLRAEAEAKEKQLAIERAKAEAELKAANEKAAKEKAEAEAKQKELEKQLAEKKAAEEKALKEAEEKKQLELSLGDKPKFENLLLDLENIKTKYEFKANKYKLAQNSVNELIDKIIIYTKNKI